jgi:hypothetical protein
MASLLLLLIRMATVEARPPRLCYLEAAQIRGPVDSFDHLELKDRHNEGMGRLDGIIIDAAARRMQYFVVEQGVLHRRRYLLPLCPTAIDTEEHVLRMDMDKTDLSACARFNPASFRKYSDEDLLAALFNGYDDALDPRLKNQPL